MEMISNLNQALQKLDALKAQLEQTEKTLKANQPDAPKDLMTAISDGLKQMTELSNKVSNAPSEGLGFRESSKLSEKLGRLFSLLESANAAPTPAMKEFFDELQPQYQSAINEINQFLSNGVPKLNDKLKAGGAPTLILSK
jgi:ABC-type transporter Mla subunit MlaD